MYKIEKLWAFVADNSDGVEGIMASGFTGIGIAALVTSRRHIAQMMLPMARDASEKTGIPFKILEFSVRKDVTQEFTDV